MYGDDGLSIYQRVLRGRRLNDGERTYRSSHGEMLWLMEVVSRVALDQMLEGLLFTGLPDFSCPLHGSFSNT